ncbi:MAG: hypothetical protein WA963_01990 [Bermanella sp.]
MSVWRKWMMPRMKQDNGLYSYKYVIISALFFIVGAIFSSKSFSETRVVTSDVPGFGLPPTMYAGFSRLLDDESILVPEELLDVDNNIKRIAFYHNGDRLHRKIPKQVHLMIENKLLGKFMGLGRFEVIDCIECRTTRVNFEDSRMMISQSAQSNQDLRNLSKDVRADAFLLWSASVHEDKFTVNLRLVSAKSNELVWLKEYAKKTTREQEELEFESIEMEMVVSSWGLASERDGVGAVEDATLSGVTGFGLRRREYTTLNKDVEYSLGVEYFRNFSSSDEFNVSGFNLEGRIFVNISALKDWVNTKAYVGIGQAFFSGSHGLMMKFGLEFPFVTNGFMAIGAVYLVKEDVEWDSNADYEDSSEFGGAGLDLTLGYRF